MEVTEYVNALAYHVSEANDHIARAIEESREEGFQAGGREAMELMRLLMAWSALFHAAVWLTDSCPSFTSDLHRARWKGYEQAATMLDDLIAQAKGES